MIWFAPSDLWNAAHGPYDILCPVCFVSLAEATGIKPTAWRIAPEMHATEATATAYEDAMRAYGVPSEPLQVYDSNSWRRVGLAREYRIVMFPCNSQSDGHPDISGGNVLQALVAAFNVMLERPTDPTTTERR